MVSHVDIKKYFKLTEEYKKKFGKDRTLVIMQMGSFYSMYAYEDQGCDKNAINELLSITITRTRKKNPLSFTNPNLLGFPVVSLEKHLTTLLDNGYVVIQVVQKDNYGSIKREVEMIHTPGINTTEIVSPDSNNIISIYFEEESQKDKSVVLCSGMSCVDLTTGKVLVHEFSKSTNDNKLSLDEVRRFLNITQPKEILVNISSSKEKKKDVVDPGKKMEPYLKYLELKDKPYRTNESLPNDIHKCKYQNEILSKVYSSKKNLLSPIEFLELEKMPYCVVSFIILIDYILINNPHIIQNIRMPEFIKSNTNLILGNDAIYQLNIFENTRLDSKGSGSKKQYKSLFDVVNKTSCAIGRRYLKNALATPLTVVAKIQERYDSIAELLEKNLVTKIEKNLKKIPDLERLHRRMSLGSLHPCEFRQIYDSYSTIIDIIQLLEKKSCDILLPNSKKLNSKKIREIIDEYFEYFDLDKMDNYIMSDIAGSFFNKGINKKIDKLQNKINDCKNFMSLIKNKFENVLNENKEDTIKITYNKKAGYHLTLTTKRAQTLKNEFAKLDKEKIIIGKEYQLNPQDLSYKKTGSSGNTTKIYFDDFNKQSEELMLLEIKIGNLVKKEYVAKISEIYNKYSKLYIEMTNYIGFLDFVKSCAKVATEYNYVKPKIVLKDKAYLKAKEVRHPIIERINVETEYIPHDITLGINDKDGLMIYGVNSVGKSSMMKTTGLVITMAQCGMYVPAKKLVYHPYEAIYARITGNDNLFKGLSSFELEMTELRSIINRTNKNTLVIGDEICRGTEFVSGICLVTATVLELAEIKCSFIFASHLHAVSEMQCIKELENVSSKHMKIEQGENDTLIFNRQLKDGTGDQIYGLLIAKHIINNPKFIKRASEIKDVFLKNISIMFPKKSKYNKQVYIYDCQICGAKDTDKLDTHHINEQKKCQSGFVDDKPHIAKHAVSNLVILCKKCHQDVHNGNLEIKGYQDTTEGKKLNWFRTKKIKDKQLKIIKKMKKEFGKPVLYLNETLVKAQKGLLKNNEIQVSKITIEKIWKGAY